jgi:hypothetical protein
VRHLKQFLPSTLSTAGGAAGAIDQAGELRLKAATGERQALSSMHQF